MPPNTVKVDRSGPFGNPWRIVAPRGCVLLWWVQGPRADEECNTKSEAFALSLRKFRYHAETHPDRFLGLRGKNLACWCGLCSDHRGGRPLGIECAACEPCHADVLLALVNAGKP